MVYIIDGEVVSENDPRVRQRQQRQTGGGTGGAVHGLGSGGGSSGLPQQAHPSQSAGEYYGDSAGRMQMNPQQQPQNPLMQLAAMMGMQDSYVDIPAVSAINLPAQRVHTIYIILAALLVLLFGWRALLFGAVIYFVVVSQQQRREGPAAGGG